MILITGQAASTMVKVSYSVFTAVTVEGEGWFVICLSVCSTGKRHKIFVARTTCKNISQILKKGYAKIIFDSLMSQNNVDESHITNVTFEHKNKHHHF